jgi:hypothetical protein
MQMVASPYRPSSKLTLVDARYGPVGSRLVNTLTGHLEELDRRLDTKARLGTLATHTNFIKQTRFWYGLAEALNNRCHQSAGLSRSETLLEPGQRLHASTMPKKSKQDSLGEKIRQALFQGQRVLYLASERQPREQILDFVRERTGCRDNGTILYTDPLPDLPTRVKLLEELQVAATQLENAIQLEQQIGELKNEKQRLEDITRINATLETIKEELTRLSLNLLELRQRQASAAEFMQMQTTLHQTKEALEQTLCQHNSRAQALANQITELLCEQEKYTEILGISPGLYEDSSRKLEALRLHHLNLLKRPDWDHFEHLNREQKQLINDKQAGKPFALATSYSDFFRSRKLVSIDFDLVILDEIEFLPLPAFYFFANTCENLVVFSGRTQRFDQGHYESASGSPGSTTGAGLIDCHEPTAWLTMSILDWQKHSLMEAPLVRDTLLTNEDTFWEYFIADLKAAKEEIFIVSPYVYPKRLEQIIEHLVDAQNRSVKVRLVISREPQGKEAHYEKIRTDLAAHGFEVHAVGGIHQKVAIIDGCISWEGSLNILSHWGKRESMRRLPGVQVAQDILHNLHLKLDSPHTEKGS